MNAVVRVGAKKAEKPPEGRSRSPLRGRRSLAFAQATQLPGGWTRCSRPRALVLAALVAVGGCTRPAGTAGPAAARPGDGPIRFDDVTAATGIDFVHTDGHSGRRYIVETISAGLGTFDYDGDGRIDIYLVNGAPLPGGPDASGGPVPRNALCRNLGGFRFVDVARAAGVDDAGYGVGTTAADYDNDGFADLYVCNFGTNRLYHNNGDGTFADVTEEAGVGRGVKVGAGAAFLDVDADGDVDLYVANYVKFTFDNHVEIREDGHPRYAGPRSYEPETHELFRNDGDGRFTDVSGPAGIAAHPGSGMGVIAGDFDDDGDADIVVLNDVLRNFLLRNDGRGVFEEAGIAAGIAYNGNGDELGSMGVDCADYDDDGRLDCLVTSYQGEMPVLFRNTGGGTFADATARARAGTGTVAHVKWGVGIVDFDNDGHRDIFYALGHLQDTIELTDRTTAWRVRNVLLRGDGRGAFGDVTAAAGSGLEPVASSRGAAFDDLDDDGRVDAVITNARERPTIIRNTSPGGHWLEVRLVGTRANRDAVGARVIVDAGGRRRVAEVHAGRGYQGHFGTRLSFGLGAVDRVDRVLVRWPGGGTTALENVAADRLVRIVEPSAPRAREDGRGA